MFKVIYTNVILSSSPAPSVMFKVIYTNKIVPRKKTKFLLLKTISLLRN